MSAVLACLSSISLIGSGPPYSRAEFDLSVSKNTEPNYHWIVFKAYATFNIQKYYICKTEALFGMHPNEKMA